MIKNNRILALLLTFAMVALPVLSAVAAPAAQSSTVDGTVQSCTTSTDAYSGAIIVVCTVNLTGGGTQTVSLNASEAQSLGLVTVNPDGTVTIIATTGQTITIDPSLVLSDPCTLPSGANQPVSAALANYFCKSLGIDYNTIQTLKQAGLGFGEIAQACHMAQVLGGTGSMCQTILDDKKSGDYSNLNLPDGVTVKNWGQLRKVVFAQVDKNKVNLGGVKSGRDDGTSNGNGQDNGHGNKDNSHGNGHGKGH
jgi:hypothetical protein